MKTGIMAFEAMSNNDGDETSIDIKVYINDENFSQGYCTDFWDLIHSAVKSGEYYPLTCGCGIPECAGLWEPITVEHHDNYIDWSHLQKS